MKNVNETATYLSGACRSLCEAPYRKEVNPLTFGNRIKARPGDSELTSCWRAFLTTFEGNYKTLFECGYCEVSCHRPEKFSLYFDLTHKSHSDPIDDVYQWGKAYNTVLLETFAKRQCFWNCKIRCLFHTVQQKHTIFLQYTKSVWSFSVFQFCDV